MQNNKLGEFIRAHRERIKPVDVGLPDGGRRRTPGLRREELAQLCDVSPTWLTWLEQGRPVSASAKMLGKLANVMHLTIAERAYLFGVAEKLDPELATEGMEPAEGLGTIVDTIKVPAYILNRQWDAVAWNRAASDLFVGWLDCGSSSLTGSSAPPNLLQFMFLERTARKLIVDWPDRAERLVAEFRADCGKYADQEPLARLIAALAETSNTFRQLWTSQHVVRREGGARNFSHPVQGMLTFDQTTFHLAKRHDLKLVMLLPT
ncbi:MAG: helix-turn-helix transcriptional regulator [Pseudomonadota bacterium]